MYRAVSFERRFVNFLKLNHYLSLLNAFSYFAPVPGPSASPCHPHLLPAASIAVAVAVDFTSRFEQLKKALPVTPNDRQPSV